MKICISSGHGLKIRGASASPRPPYLDEVDEARRVVDRVAQLWRENGVGVEVFHDNTSTSQSQNLNTIVNWHNSKSRDYDVSCHFNAYQKTSKAMGCEVLYVTQQKLAADTSAAIAGAAGWPNRGAKKRTDLAFLNGTAKPAILLEVCFVDSESDGNVYRAKFEQICKRIAEVVGKITIGTAPPVEPPTEPVEPPTHPDTEHNRVDIVGVMQGHVNIKLNGELIYGEVGCPNLAELTISKVGDVLVTINGEEFHNYPEGGEQPPPPKPVFASNHQNIICTVFGGNADPNNSAYSPYDKITDTEKSVALPYKWSGTRPLVLVHNVANGKEVVCEIRDVGPWHTNDSPYVMGTARPAAEPAGSTISYGKNQGRTSNGAGIDLTPGSAKAIGLSGKGTVHWRFVDG